MNVITLHQPYASLVAHGIKTVETRSKAPPKKLIGERIGIHAGKTFVEDPDTISSIMFEIGEIIDHETRNLLTDKMVGRNFPQGAIIATATLEKAAQIYQISASGDVAYAADMNHPEGRWNGSIDVEIDLLGDYRLDGWLWFLTDIERLETPVPARGMPGVWDHQSWTHERK